MICTTSAYTIIIIHINIIHVWRDGLCYAYLMYELPISCSVWCNGELPINILSLSFAAQPSARPISAFVIPRSCGCAWMGFRKLYYFISYLFYFYVRALSYMVLMYDFVYTSTISMWCSSCWPNHTFTYIRINDMCYSMRPAHISYVQR